MTMPNDQFTLGEHSATIDMLLAGQAQMSRDISEIKSILSARAGERGAVRWVSTTLAGVAGGVATLIVHWFQSKGTP